MTDPFDSRQATRLDAITGRFDPWLLLLCGTLLAFGVVMVASSSIAIGENHDVGAFYFLNRHLLFVALGLGLAFAATRVELKWLDQRSQWLLLGCFALLLAVLIPGLGASVNGARRWLNLLVIRFQAVEAVKVLLIMWLASYLVRFRDDVPATWIAMLKPIGVAIALVALLILQPDFGSSALLLAITGGMLVLGGASMPRMFLPVALLLPALAVIALAAPYRMRRLTSFTDPFADPFGDGYQLSNALMAVARGEWFGVGLGGSIQKLAYLPEAHTDFIMAVIAEELGFVGVCAVVGLYALLVGRAFWIGLRCVEMRRPFPGYLAFGVGLWIGLQSFVSIGVNLGLLPTKGLTLPLISSGGSSILMTCLAMGLLLRVSYELSRAERQVARLRGDAAAAGMPAGAPGAAGTDHRAVHASPAATPAADAWQVRGQRGRQVRIEPVLRVEEDA